MSLRTFIGGAPLVKKVVTIVAGGTIAATDTFAVTIGAITFTFTATTTTPEHVHTGLYDLIIDSQELGGSQGWANLTVEDNGAAGLVLTANNPGEDFTVSVLATDVSGGADPTLTATVTTANSGPEVANIAPNYSGAAVPVDSDTVAFEGKHFARYGLDQSSVTPERIDVRDFFGHVGLPPTNQLGGYPEYREQYAKWGAAGDGVTVDINVYDTNRSGLIRFNINDAQGIVSVYGTGPRDYQEVPAFCFLGSHADNVVNFIAGNCGIATEPGETATAKTVRIGRDAVVELGEGASITNCDSEGGTVTLYCDVANYTAFAGNSLLIDDPDITTLLKVLSDATVTINGGPTIAKLVLLGKLDMSKDVRPVTITNCDIYAGAEVFDPRGRITWSNAIVKKECDFDDIKLVLGHGKSVSFA